MHTGELHEADDLVIPSGSLQIHVQRLGPEEEYIDRYGHSFGKTPIAITLEQGKKRFELASLIAPGWRLVESAENHPHCTMQCEGAEIFLPIAHEGPELVEYAPFFTSRMGVMTALHEAGHSWQMHRMTPAEEREDCMAREFLLGSDAEAFEANVTEILLRQVYWPECDAWKYAMRQRAMLKELGFDITQNISEADLRAVIKDDLLSYRTGLGYCGVEFPSEKHAKITYERRR